MSNQKFKTGDVVCLKSGGPAMTVRNYGENSYDNLNVLCDWFEGLKENKFAWFHQDQLELDDQ